MKRLSLYCHVCGQPLPDYFTALSPADRTDRPFLAHKDCAKQADDTHHAVDVATRREPSPVKK